MEQQQKHDIKNLDDIKLMVDSFYTNVRNDGHIGPIFLEKIGDNWPAHLAKMYRFWETILLDAYTYQGTPFLPHATLPIDHEHFETWKGIFSTTVNSLFAGPKADEAIARAGKMAAMFESKLDYMRKFQTKPLI